MISVVTGAGGFIGSHLVEALLRRGDRVRALVHYNALGHRGHLEEVVERLAVVNEVGPSGAPCIENDEDRKTGASVGDMARRLEIVAGDVQDARCVRELVHGADVVFHLAALIGIPYSYQAPQSYVQTNVVGTLNVLEACRTEGVGRLLHTSTSEALGTAVATPQDESHPLQAQSPYAATKIAADKLAESYYFSFDLPVTIVRPFNTYGPRQSARAVIPTIIMQALTPGSAQIRLGALEPVRDLTYVDDTVRAFVMLSEAPLDVVAGRLYHLGSGEGISIGELARLTLEVLGIDKPIVRDDRRVRPKNSEVRRLIGDNRRIREEVGWTPQTSLRDGLRLTAEWIQTHIKTYRLNEYTV